MQVLQRENARRVQALAVALVFARTSILLLSSVLQRRCSFHINRGSEPQSNAAVAVQRVARGYMARRRVRALFIIKPWSLAIVHRIREKVSAKPAWRRVVFNTVGHR